MSKQSTLWAVIVIGATALIGSAIAYSPVAQGGPTIPAGGKAGKIRSYYASGSGSGFTAISSTEGEIGFVITDIVGTSLGNGIWNLQLRTGSATGPIIAAFAIQGTGTTVYSPPGSYHFASGIPVPANTSVVATFNSQVAEVQLTISGYAY